MYFLSPVLQFYCFVVTGVTISYYHTRCLTLSEVLVNGVATQSQGLNEYSNIIFSTKVTNN